MDNGLESSFLLTHNQAYQNTRIKYYRASDGSLHPYEMMVCNRNVFGSGCELSDYSKEIINQLEYKQAAAELFDGAFPASGGYVSTPATKQELLDSSRRRAKRKIFDYCICNEFDIFITLTLDRNIIDRDNYGAVIRKLNTFLSNRVNRNGLKYIGVPEYHKNGGLHFHFVATADSFKLVDSGTVSCKGYKKPMKVSTADRRGIPVSDRHTVYNIADWKLGFSTAIKTYGQRGALAHYLSKELCKPVQKNLVDNGSIDKIGGRWYYHGGKLNKPVIMYEQTNYSDFDKPSYMVDTEGGTFKVYKFDDNGVLLGE